MKKFLSTQSLVLLLSLLISTVATAQNNTSQVQTDTTLVSERVEGDTRIKLYRIERSGDSDYSLHYSINNSSLNTGLGNNSEELSDMDKFISSLTTDTMRTIRSIVVTGYSSPDGPHTLNERLAKMRMNNFLNYADKRYNLSSKFNLQRNYVAEDWDECRNMVESSNIPHKDSVLNIISQNITPALKEQHLKQMPEVWEYMATNILPPLRRVVVQVAYVEDSTFEQRIAITPPKPAPAPAPAPKAVAESKSTTSPCDCLVVDEEITGIMVATPY